MASADPEKLQKECFIRSAFNTIRKQTLDTKIFVEVYFYSEHSNSPIVMTSLQNNCQTHSPTLTNPLAHPPTYAHTHARKYARTHAHLLIYPPVLHDICIPLSGLSGLDIIYNLTLIYMIILIDDFCQVCKVIFNLSLSFSRRNVYSIPVRF